MGKHTLNGKGLESVTVNGNGHVTATCKGLVSISSTDSKARIFRIKVYSAANRPEVILKDVHSKTKVYVNNRRFN